jgi:hypothetical protein
MNRTHHLRSRRLAVTFLALGLFVLLAAHGSRPAAAEPDAALTFVNASTSALNCLFAADCATTSDNTTSTFTVELTTGAGFLQSRLWSRGQAGRPGAGLVPYLYRLDLRELVGPGNPVCVTSIAFDFGPVVPLDYNGDGSKEHGFVMTGDNAGSMAPSAVSLTAGRLTFTFAPAVCGDASPAQDDGKSTFFFGLASPFRDREVTADMAGNWGTPLALAVRAPQFSTAPALTVVPTYGLAGDTVQLVGSGYEPGAYPGTIRWNGADVGTLAIPDGGAFSHPFTIPESAAIREHIIAVCALNPCAAGEFEQLAEAPFAVTGPVPGDLNHHAFLPAMHHSGFSSAQPFSYVIDGSVVPSQAELPRLDGVTPRPLAAVRDPHGSTSTFVVNELVLQTDGDSILAGLLNRTGGEILLEVDPNEAGLADLPKTYLIRVNLNRANLSGLVGDVTALIPPGVESAGQFAFSSTDATRLFALAAHEAAGDLVVGVNWVSDTDAIPTDSNEAPAGTNWLGTVYSPDAYDWVYLAKGTTQDIGVPEAWTLMSRAGRLSNRVDLAILDGGFFPNPDFPTSMTFVSVIPFITDARNVRGADGRAPFHGTDVLQTAVARSDDDFGIVGVAAPVARPIAVLTTYDYFMSIAAIIAARAAGADIINMSYGADVPAVFAWTVWPFDTTTAIVGATGALLFAAAGNDGQDVDDEDCFIVCWEGTWHTPCENAGVKCVGGLFWNSKMRHPNSNFGADGVDIFAPYTVYSGQAPDAPGGGAAVGITNGTSFASPYAASVAALIWASNPSLSAGQVWDIMIATAHDSPDWRVEKYVNAYQAVLRAIGVGLEATLVEPINGSGHNLGYPVRLLATVGYVAVADGTPLQVEWLVDGNPVNSFTYTPGAGSHTVYPEFYASGLASGAHIATIRATAGSVVVERSATFHVFNTAPVASIDQPTSGDVFCAGEVVTLRGSAHDLNQPVLPQSAFAWNSSLNGSLGTGSTRSTSALSAGNHAITLRVTDNGGLWDEASINLTILAASHPDCLDLPPSALITSPANGAVFYADTFDGTSWYKRITFTGVVDDPEDSIGELTVDWLSDLQGSLGTPSVNPATGTTTITADMQVFEPCGSQHKITLRVEDTDHHVREDEITITVSVLC